jgi:hypothetical protein
MKKLYITFLFIYVMFLTSNVFGAGVTNKSIGGLIDIIEELETTEMWVGGGAGNVPVATTVTGTGAPVLNIGPAITSPVITNIAPGANFTLTQNSAAPFTSVESGAVVNTLYLKAGHVGIGTATPDRVLHVVGQIHVGDIADEGLFIRGGSSDAQYNWLMGNNVNIANGFEITPSTATGGTTFSTPALLIAGATSKVGIGDTSPSNGGLVVAAGVTIGTDSTNYLIDDASNGAGAGTLYIGNDTIAFSFTGKHYYQLGDMDLKTGEAVKLVNRKIYRTTSANDPLCIGIYWGISRFVDSFGNKLIQEQIAYEEKTDPNDEEKKIQVKKKNQPLVLASDNETAARVQDFAYSVAVLGDSYDEHDKVPLTGAWVMVDAGVIKAGDFLVSSSKSGYLQKQVDDIVHSYTVAKAMEDINADTKTAYIYLMQ